MFSRSPSIPDTADQARIDEQAPIQEGRKTAHASQKLLHNVFGKVIKKRRFLLLSSSTFRNLSAKIEFFEALITSNAVSSNLFPSNEVLLALIEAVAERATEMNYKFAEFQKEQKSRNLRKLQCEASLLKRILHSRILIVMIGLLDQACSGGTNERIVRPYRNRRKERTEWPPEFYYTKRWATWVTQKKGSQGNETTLAAYIILKLIRENMKWKFAWKCKTSQYLTACVW